jgi:hypothetical protein
VLRRHHDALVHIESLGDGRLRVLASSRTTQSGRRSSPAESFWYAEGAPTPLSRVARLSLAVVNRLTGAWLVPYLSLAIGKAP